MTSELFQGAAAVDAGPPMQGEPSPELGQGMAHRARSQTVLGQHWSPSGLVGAVGRASVGFGLAVGRSRAIRPTVRFDDLNSVALRPSFELWRARRAAFDDTLTPFDASPRLDASVRGRAEPAIVRRSPSAVAERRRLSVATPARPSWTDQIIQRSSVGFVAPAPGGPMPEPALPAGFVPTGDAKLDRLRLLVAERDGSAHSTGRDAAAGAGGRGSDSIPLRRSTATQPTVTTTRDTSVPGHLARSMRPEPVDPGTVPAARVGGTGAPASTDFQPLNRRRTSTSGASGTASSGSRRGTSGRPPRQAEPDKMERLRAALVERGLLSADGPAVVSEPGEAGTGGGHPTGATPPETAPAPSGGRILRSPGEGLPSGDRFRADTPSVAQAADRGTSRVTDTAADLRRAAVAPPVPTGESSSGESTGPQRSSSGESTGPQRSSSGESTGPQRSSSMDSTVEARVGRPDVTPGDHDLVPPAGSDSARAVRLQRLLRTGLAGTDNASAGARELGGVDPVRPDASGDAGTPWSEAVSSTTLRRSTSAVATVSTVGSSVDTPPALIARSAFELERSFVPELVRPGSSEPATVIRRVTLPRALSRRHRPPSAFAAREEPARAARADGVASADGVATRSAVAGSPSTHPVPRPSVVTLAELAAFAPTAGIQASAPRSGARTVPTIDPDVEMDPPGFPVRTATVNGPESDAASRRARSVVPPGTGALLDVVRRSTRSDLSPRPPTPVTGPAGRRDIPHSGLLAQRAGVESHDEVGTTLRRSSSDPVTVAVPPLSARAVAPPSASPARSGDVTSEHLDLADGPIPIRPTTIDQAARARLAAGRTAGGTEAPLRPAEQVAAEFMTALSENVRRSPAPLPTTFRPMADAIAGPRPVMLSTDPASRRALRSVGKVAATTGDTIHLDERAIPSARLAEVMAHELTHVAHPSPTPRFFDDIDDSPEERRAEQVARVMARSPLAPAASLVAPTGRGGDSVLRRSPAPNARTRSTSTARPSSPGSVSADELAAQITGSRSNQSTERSGDVVRRAPSEASPRSPSSAPPAALQAETSTSGPAPDHSMSSPVMSDEAFLAYFRDNLSEVMGLIEDRMIIEIERRGGRTWGVL